MGGKSRNEPEMVPGASASGSFSSEAQIPGFLRPFIRQSADVAGGALGDLQSLTQGDLVAPFSQDQVSAFDMARQLALGPNSPFTAATQQLQGTAAGEGFSSDAFNDAFGATVRRQQPGIISPFIGAGRGTGGLAQAALGQGQADAFAGLFNQERNRQLQSALSLPGIASAPFGLLSDIGTMQQQQAQNQLSAPLQAQQGLLGSALGGIPFGSLIGSTGTQMQSSQQPMFQNRAAGGLGGALTGAQLGSMFGPIGTGIGAVGGGLLGAFF